MRKPIIAITMGDPASIGPEISIRALISKDVQDKCNPILIGDLNVLHATMDIFNIDSVEINAITDIEQATFKPNTINILDMKLVDITKLKFGEVSAMAGEASFQYVVKAIELANEGVVDATVTNAINKEAINLAGHHFAGHTEIYAHYTNTKNYTMMLAHNNLRVVHVSTHVSLRDACDSVNKDRVLQVINIADEACKSLGILNPKIGVAGLNPHSGEGGLFGDEEIKEIVPAIELAKQEGIDVDGPVPPDTIFPKALGEWYDIVVAMYHDQGHIPLKLVGFHYDPITKRWSNIAGVNITLGLPIIRTSVDHGTAFDQVNKGTANEISLISAIDYATTLSLNNSTRGNS